MTSKNHPKAQETESRKEKILKAAMELFAEKGYHGTILDEVAKKAGITKAALYYYFRSKEQIISTIMNMGVARMNKVIGLGTSTLSPKEKLHKFIRYHVEFSADSTELSKITFEQLHALPKRTRDAFRRRQKKVDRTLQNILQEGIDDGSFTLDDVKIASYAILGLCIWTYQWYSPDGRLSQEKISEIFINLLERGIWINRPRKDNLISQTPR